MLEIAAGCSFIFSIILFQESLVARLKMVENDMRIFDSASTGNVTEPSNGFDMHQVEIAEILT